MHKLFPVPCKVEEVNMSRIEEGLRDITDVPHEIHLKKQEKFGKKKETK